MIQAQARNEHILGRRASGVSNRQAKSRVWAVGPECWPSRRLRLLSGTNLSYKRVCIPVPYSRLPEKRSGRIVRPLKPIDQVTVAALPSIELRTARAPRSVVSRIAIFKSFPLGGWQHAELQSLAEAGARSAWCRKSHSFRDFGTTFASDDRGRGYTHETRHCSVSDHLISGK